MPVKASPCALAICCGSRRGAHRLTKKGFAKLVSLTAEILVEAVELSDDQVRPMVLPTARLRIYNGFRRAAMAAMLALGGAAAGCSPIDTYRSLVGVDRNDPDPATAPFTGNIAA